MSRHKAVAGLTLTRLMDLSEREVAGAAKFGDGHQQLMADRVMESVHIYRRWESSHSCLLRTVINERKLDRQVLAARRLAISMIHRKAPFEYLRDQHVVGAERHRFFQMLYGSEDCAKAMIEEHVTYLTSGCSYLFADLALASVTMRRIARYERNCADYLRTYAAHMLVGASAGVRDQQASLLRFLRQELQKSRDSLLGPVPTQPDAMRFERLGSDRGLLSLRHSDPIWAI
jgi:hypothetical protein